MDRDSHDKAVVGGGLIDPEPFRRLARESVDASRCAPPPYGCGKIIDPETEFLDGLSLREWRITSLCQTCQGRLYEVLAQMEGEYGEEDGDAPVF